MKLLAIALVTVAVPLTRIPVTVTRAVDGDTLVVQHAAVVDRVRLLGVDTPETHKPGVPVQCYGPEAAKFTADYTTGYHATVVTEPASGDVRDRYDRLLGYVTLRRHDLGAVLLRKGFARVYAFGNRHFAKRPLYERLEAWAKAHKAGRWGACP